MAATGGVTLDYAVAVAIPLEGIFYGFSLCMFGLTCFDIIGRRTPSGRLNYKILAMACSLFTFSTIHMGVDIHRLVNGFVHHRDTVNGPVLYFTDLASFGWFFRSLLYYLQTLLGDGIVIYRCYVVWSTVRVVIFPIVLWLSAMVAGSACLWFFPRSSGDNSNIFNVNLSHWIAVFYSCTLAANAFATGLLAFRLWTLDRAVSGIRTTKGNISHVARVIADSGAIYSTFLVMIIALYASKTNVQAIIMDITMPVISICFYLIILRISRHQHLRKSFGGISSRSGPALPSGHRDGIRMQNLEVHLATDVEIELESNARKPADRYALQEEQVEP